MEKRKSWHTFLNDSGICVSGYGGNRPCDNGAYCDKCFADWVERDFKKYMEDNEGE